MAARSIGNTLISFGMVSIPAKVFSSGETSDKIDFHLLDAETGCRVKQQYVRATDASVVVGRDEMVKGYEFAKDQYVRFTADELKALDEAGSHAIDITEFVYSDLVDPVFYGDLYYLAPDKGGERGYKLLVEAMRKTGRSAVAKYANRGKTHLVMLAPRGEGMTMRYLRYADEVRLMGEIPLKAAVVKDAEIALAVQIVEQNSSDAFRPENYKDEVKARVRAAIEAKVNGAEFTLPCEATHPAEFDLMSALQASVKKAD